MNEAERREMERQATRVYRMGYRAAWAYVVGTVLILARDGEGMRRLADRLVAHLKEKVEPWADEPDPRITDWPPEFH